MSSSRMVSSCLRFYDQCDYFIVWLIHHNHQLSSSQLLLYWVNNSPPEVKWQHSEIQQIKVSCAAWETRKMTSPHRWKTCWFEDLSDIVCSIPHRLYDLMRQPCGLEFYNTHTNTRTNLRCAAHAVNALAGSHQQQVAMLVALVVNRAGQADFTTLCWDGEETAGIDKEVVADWFLLEGHSRCDQEAGET